MYISTKDNRKPKIFLLVGGCLNGKSIWAKKLALKYNAEIISKPDIRKILTIKHKGNPPTGKEIYTTLLTMIATYVAHNQNIVIDGTFITEKQRGKILKILYSLTDFQEYCNSPINLKHQINSINFLNYQIIGVYIKPNLRLAKKKNKACNYPLSPYSLDKQYQQLQKPYLDEGFHKIIKKKPQK